MRVGVDIAGAGGYAAQKTKVKKSFSDSEFSVVVPGGRLREMEAAGVRGEGEEEADENEKVRPQAEKIYQAAVSGKRNPVEDLRHEPRVPYEHLAKDGIIEYNGVVFVCDYEKHCICLGDMTDEKNVLTIPLTSGGSLKVNRSNLGDLSRAAGMFSPEDLNLIMRAIAKDAKIQSMKKEIDDIEANVGNQLGNDSTAESTEEESV